MSEYLGDYFNDDTVRTFFTTHSKTGGAIAPSDAFEAADLKIYKNGNVAQKTTTNGITLTSAFDGLTGVHYLSIDTSNDTGDAGFWAAGNDYAVILNPDSETVDGETVVALVCEFSIENRNNKSNVKSVNDTALQGVGSTANPWRPV